MSTAEQSLALQQDVMTAAGRGRTFSDVVSGAVTERDGLAAALDYVQAGDTLLVWRLDRLGRTLRHLIAQVTALNAVGIGFRSLTEAIDTTTTGGKLVFHIFGALAEFERARIRDRTRAGARSATGRWTWRGCSLLTRCVRLPRCAPRAMSRAPPAIGRVLDAPARGRRVVAGVRSRAAASQDRTLGAAPPGG